MKTKTGIVRFNFDRPGYRFFFNWKQAKLVGHLAVGRYTFIIVKNASGVVRKDN